MLTEPVIHPQIRETVPDQEVRPAEVGANEVQGSGSQSNSKIAQKDKMLVLPLVEWTGWLEMVDATPESILLALSFSFNLSLMDVVASNIGDEIHWPAEELLSDKIQSRQDWSFFHQFT